MKTYTATLCFLMGAITSSVASADEVKECWLRERSDDGARCKVILVENGRGGASPGDTSPSSPRPDCEKVKLYVDCDCDFKLKDEYATQFDKRDDEFNVGSERDKLAVLLIEDEGRIANEYGQKAVLTISSKDDHGTFARRLVGECKRKD